VTGGPKIYNVAVTGMTTTGSVTFYVPAGVAHNPADEPNLESTSIESLVFWWAGPFVAINPAVGQPDPTDQLGMTTPFGPTVITRSGPTRWS